MRLFIDFYFALRGEKERRQLRRNPSQIEGFEYPGRRPLVPTQMMFQKSIGTTEHKTIKPIVAVQNNNLKDPQWCLMHCLSCTCSSVPELLWSMHSILGQQTTKVQANDTLNSYWVTPNCSKQLLGCVHHLGFRGTNKPLLVSHNYHHAISLTAT